MVSQRAERAGKPRLPGEALNEGVRLLQPAVHDEGDTDSQASQDLLVLGLLEHGVNKVSREPLTIKCMVKP